MKPSIGHLANQRQLLNEAPPGRPGDNTPKPAVDLQALAKEVVRLLKEELRVENERLGRRPG